MQLLLPIFARPVKLVLDTHVRAREENTRMAWKYDEVLNVGTVLASV